MLKLDWPGYIHLGPAGENGFGYDPFSCGETAKAAELTPYKAVANPPCFSRQEFLWRYLPWQTIIVMSDSHGDSLIVEEIDRYLGADAIFHDGDSEIRPDSRLEGNPCRQRQHDFLCWLSRTFATQPWSDQKSSRPMGQFSLDINFSTFKLDYWGPGIDSGYSFLWSLCAKCLMEGKNTLLNPGSITTKRNHHQECLMPV